MSRGKYGNPKTSSRFICCKHLGENFIGQGIQRGGRQREKYHIKDLFCLQCACVTKCIEWRWCDDYEKVMEQADKLHKEIYEGDCTMNTYVMSDIHGCYDEFQQMLEKIHFSDRDLLICAGDYIDRGTKNYEMMSWISNAPKNVIFVRGNHDEEFLTNIRIMKYVCDEAELDENSIEDSRTLYKAVQKFAKQNNNVFFDYYGTIGKLINEKLVSFALLCDWAKIVEKMPYFYKIDINKRTCIVVHAGYIESLDHVDTEESYESVEDFYLHARDDAYMCGGVEHGMIIAGHTPTIKYEEFPYNNGNVYRMYDESLDCIFYDIDCGCVMGSVQENAKLACIRLEDEKIYYVRISDQVKSKEL